MNPTPIRLRPVLGLGVFTLLAVLSRPAAGQDSRPPAVTDSAIAAGQQLFHGNGNCSACHGDKGVGSDDGPALISGPWTLGDGSYEWLLHVVQHAAPGARSREGDPVPMRGPGTLDSAEVQAVAAYLWTISRGKPAAAPH